MTAPEEAAFRLGEEFERHKLWLNDGFYRCECGDEFVGEGEAPIVAWHRHRTTAALRVAYEAIDALFLEEVLSRPFEDLDLETVTRAEMDQAISRAALAVKNWLTGKEHQ